MIYISFFCYGWFLLSLLLVCDFVVKLAWQKQMQWILGRSILRNEMDISRNGVNIGKWDQHIANWKEQISKLQNMIAKWRGTNVKLKKDVKSAKQLDGIQQNVQRIERKRPQSRRKHWKLTRKRSKIQGTYKKHKQNTWKTKNTNN